MDAAREEDSPDTLTVCACQLSPARLTSSHWSTGFYCQVLYAKIEPIKRRFDATAAHARGGSGGSDPRAMPGRSDGSQRSYRLVPGALAPAVPLFSAVRGQIPVPSFATRAHRGADTGRKAVSRGLTRQPRAAPKSASSEASQAQFHAFTGTWTWADAAESVNQIVRWYKRSGPLAHRAQLTTQPSLGAFVVGVSSLYGLVAKYCSSRVNIDEGHTSGVAVL